MAVCSLLTMPTVQGETFSFEHNMAHRLLFASMSPLSRFSVLPYIIWPNASDGRDWHMDHQQAHNDGGGVLPGFFGDIGFGGEVPSPTGSTVSQLGPAFNIEDYFLQKNSEQKNWWTFQNHYWHLDAQSAQNSELFVFPFF